MRLRTFAATVLMTALLSGLPPSRVAAQGGRQTPAPATAPPEMSTFDRQNAHETRDRLREVLNQYPPSLGQVLRLDPSLMSNPAYLAPYPTLAAFLAQHPAVAHNPAFFLGGPQGGDFTDRSRLIGMLNDVLIGVLVCSFFITALFVIGGIARAVMAHRRWLHATKIQTDAHTKLVDRFASNEDLLAYIQSPIGQRLVSAAPAAMEPDVHFGITPAPLSRILTSIQVGVVAAFGGSGLWIAKANVLDEIAQPMQVIAILAIALGAGFVVSALLSYGLSKQWGLIHSATSSHG